MLTVSCDAEYFEHRSTNNDSIDHDVGIMCVCSIYIHCICLLDVVGKLSNKIIKLRILALK